MFERSSGRKMHRLMFLLFSLADFIALYEFAVFFVCNVRFWKIK